MAILDKTTASAWNIASDVIAEGNFTANNSTNVLMRYSSNTAYSTLGPIPFNSTILSENIQVGNNGSRFTILQSGVYMITFHNISSAAGVTTRTDIRVNGSTISQARGEGVVTFPMVNALHVGNLVVGDYIEMYHVEGIIYLAPAYHDFCIHRVF